MGKLFNCVFDLGGSGTRTVNCAELDKVKLQPSDIMEIPVDGKTDDTLEKWRYDIVIKDAPHKQLIGRRFVKGEAQSVNKGKPLQIVSGTLKVAQDSTYIAFAFAAASLVSKESVADATLNVGICIPAGESYEDKNIETLKANTVGKWVIYYPNKGVTVKFDVLRTLAMAEGPIALMPYRAEFNSVFSSGDGFILDPGHRSSDVALILRGFIPDRDSAIPHPIAGNSIVDGLAISLLAKGHSLTREELYAAVETGCYKINNTVYPCGEIIRQSKKKFAGILVDAMHMTLSKSFKTMDTIRWIAAIGRPFDTNLGEKDCNGDVIGKESPYYVGDLYEEILNIININVMRVAIKNPEHGNVLGAAKALKAIIAKAKK